MKDVILLPTYNERDNVGWIIPAIFKLLPNIYIVVIDDNSPDKTADVVKDLMKRYPNLRILERQKKSGLGNAYKDGMQRVIKDKEVRAIISMDADGSHDPQYLKTMLDNIEEYDLIVGSRYIKGGDIENWEVWRKNLSRWGNVYAKFLTGLPVNDLTAGFMCTRREYLEKLDLDNIGSDGYSFQIEFKFNLINKFKAKVKEIPIVFKERRGGESKLSNQIISEGLKKPWQLFWQRLK